MSPLRGFSRRGLPRCVGFLGLTPGSWGLRRVPGAYAARLYDGAASRLFGRGVRGLTPGSWGLRSRALCWRRVAIPRNPIYCLGHRAFRLSAADVVIPEDVSVTGAAA